MTIKPPLPSTASSPAPGRLLKLAFIVAVTGWIYFPALRGDWIWDDGAEIVSNASLRGGLSALAALWSAPSGADYFPLKATAQWIEWHLWGDSRLGYHLVSVALHLGSSLLLWRLLGRLGMRFAWLGGFLFAIHPLAVESVAWIAELKNTLSLPLLLLSALAYLDFCERRDERKNRAEVWAYARALGWFLAAVLAKSTVVMFPVMILAHAWWKRGRIARSDAVASLPFFAVSLALGIVTVWFQEHRAVAGQALPIGGAGMRIAVAGRALVFYFEKFFLPTGLSPVYPRWSAASLPPWDLAAFLLFGSILGLLGSRRQGWGRGGLFALGWFGLNLLPVLGFVPMAYARIAPVADHFVYVPMIGLIGASIALVAAAERQLASGPRSLRIGFAAAGLALAACLAWTSRSRAEAYRDDRAFWTSVLKGNPHSWIAHNDLGLILLDSGKPAEAAEQFQAAAESGDEFPEVRNNLGKALAAQGRFDAAIPQFRAALKFRPDYVDAYVNLGNAQTQAGRLREAAASYAEGLKLRPNNPEAHGYLGFVLSQLGRPDEAAREFGEAIRLDPGYAEPHYRLGNLLANLGRMDEAITEYRAAARLKPDYAEAEANLGLALTVAHRPAEGVEALRRALAWKPDYAEAHAYLGFALSAESRYSEAVGEYQAALKLGPGDADVHYNLGLALRALGRYAEARAQFDAAEARKPRP